MSGEAHILKWKSIYILFNFGERYYLIPMFSNTCTPSHFV